MSLGAVTMPRIGEVRWRKDGFGVQSIWMSAGATCTEPLPDGSGSPTAYEERPRHPIQRGYVKIWYAGDLLCGKHVVDRALTVTAARKRITAIKAAGGPTHWHKP